MNRRAAGLLLHPTSLPGRGGIGDLGPDAERWIDWLARAGIGAWQILPLGPPGRHRSPYSAASLFAGNPLLIAPERLVEDGLLQASAAAATPRSPAGRVDFARAGRWKGRLLRRAGDAFARRGPARLRAELDAFLEHPDRQAWLSDWALFAALRRRHRGRRWTGWDAELRRRDRGALARCRRELREELRYHGFVRFLFFRQWTRLRRYANRHGIRLLGDLPIYPAHDSADVWAHPELFELDAAGNLGALAGVPPDYYSRTGQLWRQPVYRWDELERRGFEWWVRRVRHQLALHDTLRLDHFRGFAAYWRVPAGERTAQRGRWVAGPGRRLFDALRRELGALPLIAEDLGEITPDVHELRRGVGLPGMKVLQFAFDDPDSEHLPRHHSEDTVVYTGTHDNDTTRGWFAALAETPRRRALALLDCPARDVSWGMVRTAYASPARLAVVPAQDLLDLGSEARMNTPGRSRGNWTWRAPAALLEDGLARRLHDLATRTSRLA